MATKISAVMTVTDPSGNKASKSVTDINPTANKNAIVDFVRGLNSLTNNTLDNVELVTKEDILSSYDATDPQFSIEPTFYNEEYPAVEGKTITLRMKYKGNHRSVSYSGKKYNGARFTNRTNKTMLLGIQDGIVQSDGSTATTTITLAAGDGYKAASVQFTFYNLNANAITDAGTGGDS